MKTVTVNHSGKRAFNFMVENGFITYDWIDYVDQDGSEVLSDVKAKEIVKIDNSIKGQKTIFYN
ncbi:hypothetical protein [Sphingobacterium sp. 2149]|uniref:hypothetical protein n=1 Tax=Sphingobacterium sp. 2149 TaxID=2817763 RepID=UPI00285601E7|nr:hypothetical protein [Sphingobacterium sp. 2149]MDR6734129.1 hypothetical protein [Sphingobacterium sp. 2149]